jgi:hypothetical protein
MWVWGMDVETPHTGSCFFSESIQYEITGVVEDVDSGLGEGDRAVSITELSHAEEVVGERVHDEAIVSAWWKLWEWHLGFADGCDSITVCNSDMCWWFIVIERGVGSSAMEVVLGGSSVSDGCEVGVVVEL